MLVVASQDTYVDVDFPNQAFGSATVLKAYRYVTSSSDTYPRRGKLILLHFDLGNLSDQEITSAKLKFQITGGTRRDEADSSGDLNIKSITLMPYTGWSEDTLTFEAIRTPGTNMHIHPFSYGDPIAFIPAQGNKPHYGIEIDGELVATIDMTEQIKPLAGHQFVAVVEDHQNWDFGVYSRRDGNHLSPQLEIVSQPAAVPLSPELLVSFSPPPLDLATIPCNPMTGLYKWRNNEINPNFLETVDEYDRYTWDKFESAQGVYDFSALENDIQKAADQGRKYGFRIRAMENNGNAMPAYMQSHTESCGGYVNVPKFNAPFVIERSRALMEALGAKYNGDPRIAWVDIGMYGRFGEWVAACGTPPDDVQEAYIDMHTDHFPDTQLVFKLNQSYGTKYALNKPPNNNGQLVGIRYDTVGRTNFLYRTRLFRMIARYDIDVFRQLIERWKYAPWVTEFENKDNTYKHEVYTIAEADCHWFHIANIGNGNTYKWDELNAEQRGQFTQAGNTPGYKYQLNELGLSGELLPGAEVMIYHSWSNMGATPTYEPWEAVLEFRADDAVYQFPLSVDFRKLLPTYNRVTQTNSPAEYADNITLDIPAGDYDLHLVIRDPRPGFPCKPMKLFSGGLQAGGSYRLGSVSIVAPLPMVEMSISLNGGRLVDFSTVDGNILHLEIELSK